MNSSVLSFPYGPTLTSIHNYWKKAVCIPEAVIMLYVNYILILKI